MSDPRPILLIEDNPDDVELTLRTFDQNGISNPIIVLSDGAQAEDWLFGPGGPKQRPALIMLDLKLPKVSGLELLRRLREGEATRLIPIVVLSSSREEADLLKCYSVGANSYVRKPVNIDQFRETVRYLGLYWLMLNEPPPPSSERPA